MYKKILERLSKSIIFSIAASPKGKLYFIDEESTFINKHVQLLDICDGDRIKFTSDSEEIVEYINEVYLEFRNRKNNRISGNDIYLFIYNIHFCDIIQEILSGYFVESSVTTKENSGFDFFTTASKYLSYEDENEFNDNSDEISLKDKLSQIIKEGYKYGVHTLLSVNDWSFYYDNLFDFRNSFKNKIIYALPPNEAERFIPDVDIGQLRENMAIYTDGMREKSQFKPYKFDQNVLSDEFVSKIRGKIYEA